MSKGNIPELKRKRQGLSGGNLNPSGIYLFKVNNGNNKEMCEICSKLTIKTLALER